MKKELRFYRITRDPIYYLRERVDGKWELLNKNRKLVGVYPFEGIARECAIEYARAFVRFPKSQAEKSKNLERQLETLITEL